MKLEGLKVWVSMDDGAAKGGWATYVDFKKGEKFALEDSAKDVIWSYAQPGMATYFGPGLMRMRIEMVAPREGPGFLASCGSIYLLSDLLTEVEELQENDLDDDGTYWAVDYQCMAEQLLAEEALKS